MQTKQYLGYLGLVPFTLPLIFEQVVEELFTTTAEQVFIFYSAIILSFVSGTLWRKSNDMLSIKLQILSNIFCLLAFFALLIPSAVAFVVLALTYSMLLLCEQHYFGYVAGHNDYLEMRKYLTIIVILLQISAFILWET